MVLILGDRTRAKPRWADVGAGACLGALAAVCVVQALGVPVAEPAPVAVEAETAFSGTALSVIDGDTFEARVRVFPGQEIVTRVRLAGVDAPERRGRCASEVEAATDATRALSALVEGRPLQFSGVRPDKYFGRVVARVSTAEAGDLAQALIAARHGRAYAGGKRVGWC